MRMLLTSLLTLLSAVTLYAADSSELVKQLVPPGTGNDAAARLELRQVSYGVLAPDTAAAERAAHVTALSSSLHSQTNREVKAFLIRELRICAGTESIDLVASYLSDPELCEPATQTLLSIGIAYGPDSVKAAIRKALLKSEGKSRLTLVRAAGSLRDSDKAVLKALLKDCDSSDSTLRMAALHALANSGSAVVADKLLKTATEGPWAERAKAFSWLYVLAERLHEAGKSAEAAALCRKALLIPSDTKRANTIAAGLYTLSNIAGKKATPDLLKYADSKNPQLRAAVATILIRTPGKEIDDYFISRLKMDEPLIRAEALRTLTLRNPEVAAPHVVKGLTDTDGSVRIAAAEAAVGLTPAVAVPALMSILEKGSSEEKKSVRSALTRMAGDEVSALIAKAYGQSETPEWQALVLTILAGRQARAHSELAVTAASSEQAVLRKAAIDALKSLSRPADLTKLYALLYASDSSAELKGIRGGISYALKQMADESERSLSLKTEMAQKSGESLTELLKITSSIGGTDSLTLAKSYLTHSDAETREAAVWALAKWPNAGALPVLLQIAATSKEDSHKILAVRGALPWIEKSKASPDEKLKRLHVLLAAATREGEKTLITKRIAETGGANLAIGKPVKTTVKHQGTNNPEKAVDGDIGNDSGWWGSSWPGSLQVDLGSPQNLSGARPYFYSDGKRFYTYTIEVSKDGKSWTAVVDNSKHNKPATADGILHEFSKKARYVRINVLRNNSNGSIHLLEFEVYRKADK